MNPAGSHTPKLCCSCRLWLPSRDESGSFGFYFFKMQNIFMELMSVVLLSKWKQQSKELDYQATCYKLTLKVMGSLQRCQVWRMCTENLILNQGLDLYNICPLFTRALCQKKSYSIVTWTRTIWVLSRFAGHSHGGEMWCGEHSGGGRGKGAYIYWEATIYWQSTWSLNFPPPPAPPETLWG